MERKSPSSTPMLMLKGSQIISRINYVKKDMRPFIKENSQIKFLLQ